MEISPILMFVLQALLAVVMLFFGFILNGVRTSIENTNSNMERIATDLTALNNAVLGQYVTKSDSDNKWKDQRVLDHEMRDLIQKALIDIATIKNAPYDHG